MLRKLSFIAMTLLVLTSFIASETSQLDISVQVGNATIAPSVVPTPIYHNINLGEGIGNSILIALKGTAQFTALVTDSMMSTSSGATDLVVLWVMIAIGFVGVIVMVANGIKNAQDVAKGKKK